eukprot:4629500-Pyramimonas_sp.AAC.1
MKAIVTAPESFCVNGCSKLVNGGDMQDTSGKKRVQCIRPTARRRGTRSRLARTRACLRTSWTFKTACTL